MFDIEATKQWELERNLAYVKHQLGWATQVLRENLTPNKKENN
ncbi:hypothetical protein NVP1101O_178 [Vibrio phage 1.101.O._10N.261.45.C6]|nr:hypothetical protein NVP1101O_178 [Vibrio phage 1.101.O._10N.261.45.C6]